MPGIFKHIRKASYFFEPDQFLLSHKTANVIWALKNCMHINLMRQNAFVLKGSTNRFVNHNNNCFYSNDCVYLVSCQSISLLSKF